MRKPDEMERQIIARAQRNGYLFLVASLLAWSLYESWEVYRYRDPLDLRPCALLGLAVLVQGFSQLVLARRAVTGDPDSHETGPLVKLVVLACAVAAVIATAVAALVMLGVPG